MYRDCAQNLANCAHFAKSIIFEYGSLRGIKMKSRVGAPPPKSLLPVFWAIFVLDKFLNINKLCFANFHSFSIFINIMSYKINLMQREIVNN